MKPVPATTVELLIMFSQAVPRFSTNHPMPPNGWRYPLVGGTRQRHFDGANLKPHEQPENAQTPTTPAPAYFAGVRVHAVLASRFVLF
jgi:hypothetical protein